MLPFMFKARADGITAHNLEVYVTIVLRDEKRERERVITHTHLARRRGLFLWTRSWCSTFRVENKQKMQEPPAYHELPSGNPGIVDDEVGNLEEDWEIESSASTPVRVEDDMKT